MKVTSPEAVTVGRGVAVVIGPSLPVLAPGGVGRHVDLRYGGIGTCRAVPARVGGERGDCTRRDGQCDRASSA